MQWPHVLWERIDFDGIKRWSTGDEPTPSARHNARLPRHPAMEFSASSKDPSLLPTRKDAPLQILSADQAQDMDLRGFTVIEDAFSTAEIRELREEIDRLGAGGMTGEQSALVRSFCGGSFFQKICHDVLNCDGVRLFDQRVECREPGADPGTAFHQDIAQIFVEPLQYLTCWIALDDADEISGCPWFVPALFRRGPLRHDVDETTGDLVISNLRSDDAVSVPLQKGSVALYWSLTPYRIGANDTDKPGLAYISQYAPDGYDDRIWDNAANAGQGGPMAADAARRVLDEARNFLVLPPVC
jgi:hypothetical protein